MQSTILDHTGKPFRLSQRQSRPVRAKYDAAQTARDSQNHWANADSLSASAANSPEVRQKLRDRARYEFANNTYCAGMVRTFATDVIGTGPRLQMQSGNPTDDSLVELAFWRWCVASRFSDKLRTMRVAQARDGESFGIMVSNPMLRHPVKLDVRAYEADQIASPLQKMLANDRNADGIQFDANGNPEFYELLKSHPGDTANFNLTSDADLIPARFVVHMFHCDRPGQIRGVPEITPALPLYAQLRRYTLAVIAAAETAANIAGLLQTQQTPSEPDDIEPLDLFDLERGQLMTLPKGWTAEQMKAEQPATTYEMFKREIIQEIARCLGMPYNVAAGDSSSYNYSSGRLDHKTYYKLIRVDRSHWETDCLDRVFAEWWEEARRLDDVLPDELRLMGTPPLHSWVWDGDEHIDPLKEATAQQVRLACGMTTFAHEYGQVGRDWEDEFRQRAREEELRKELGLVLEQDAEQPASDEALAMRIADLVLEHIR